MIPADPRGGLPGLASVDLAAFWSKYQASAPRLLRAGFRLAVIALTWLPLARHGRPFHRLPADARDAFLTTSAASRSYLLRQLVTVVKLIACFGYCFDVGIQRAIREPKR